MRAFQHLGLLALDIDLQHHAALVMLGKPGQQIVERKNVDIDRGIARIAGGQAIAHAAARQPQA